MKCKKTRSGDEIQCSCGLTWGVDEVDPHPLTATEPVDRDKAALKYLKEMREALKS